MSVLTYSDSKSGCADGVTLCLAAHTVQAVSGSICPYTCSARCAQPCTVSGLREWVQLNTWTVWIQCPEGGGQSSTHLSHRGTIQVRAAGWECLCWNCCQFSKLLLAEGRHIFITCYSDLMSCLTLIYNHVQMLTSQLWKCPLSWSTSHQLPHLLPHE